MTYDNTFWWMITSYKSLLLMACVPRPATFGVRQCRPRRLLSAESARGDRAIHGLPPCREDSDGRAALTLLRCLRRRYMRDNMAKPSA